MTVTAPELKTALAEALGERLGTYTFSARQTTPAIRTDDGTDPFDEEPTVQGLEVVIVPQIEVPMKQMMGGWQDTYTTLIVLKQWDIQENTLAVRDLALNALMQFDTLAVGQIRRVMRTTKLDNIETLTIPVSENVWVPADDEF